MSTGQAPQASEWFVPQGTYTRTIKHPDSGAEAEVTYRVLNAGDRAAIDDTIAMQFADDAKVRPELKLGTMKRMTVARAVQSWTLPGTPTEAALASLHPDVFEAILEHVGWGSVPAEKAEEPDPLAAAAAATSDGESS